MQMIKCVIAAAPVAVALRSSVALAAVRKAEAAAALTAETTPSQGVKTSDQIGETNGRWQPRIQKPSNFKRLLPASKTTPSQGVASQGVEPGRVSPGF